MAAAMLVLAACGDSNADDTAEPTTSTPAAVTSTPDGAVEVTLGTPKEFALTPARVAASGGSVTWKVSNKGKFPHEFVVIKTDKGAGELAGPNGEAGEDGVVREIENIPAGATKNLKTTLAPGAYALICNLPGHYAGGMYADFTVE